MLKVEKRTILGYILAFWLVGVFISRLYVQIALASVGNVAIAVQVMSVIWPVFYFVFSKHSLLMRGIDGITGGMLFLFVFTALISCFISPIPFFSVGYLLATFAGIYVAILFNEGCNKADIAFGFKLFSILTVILLVIYTKYDYRTFIGYRLGDGTRTMNPNSVGMIAMAAVVTAMMFKSFFVRAILFVPLFFDIYLTGSRAAALATLIALVIFSWQDFVRTSIIKKIAIVVPILIITIVIIFLKWESIYDGLNSFFLWDDRHRGFSSGGSGRTTVWGWVIELIKNNFIFGVGFRAHGEFIAASSAHNGYLALCAEIGVFGFSAIMVLIIRKLFLLFKIYRNSTDSLLALFFGVFVAFLALAMFERYLLNIGNPVSLIFLMILFMSKEKLINFVKGK